MQTAVNVLGFFHRGVEAVDIITEQLAEQPARLGEKDALPGAVKQGKSQFLFQQRNLLADGRLGDEQSGGSLGET